MAIISTNRVKLPLLCLLLLVTTALIAVPSTHAAASSVKVYVNGIDHATEDIVPVVVNATTYVPLRFIAEKLKAVVDWNSKTRKVTVVFPGHYFQINKSLTRNDKTYVPVRFFAENLGARVSWKANRIDIALKDNYVMDWATGKTAVFWFDKSNGDLFQSMPITNKPQKVGRLDFKLGEFVTFSVDGLDDNRFALTVHDNFGEPHIGNHVYSAYVANGKLLRQSMASYSHLYRINVNKFGNQAVITDGKQLEILKANGETDKQYDLTELGGSQADYAVEYMGEKYWLIRPYPSRLLIWVDPATGARKPIYTYFNEQDQAIALSSNDTPNFGDGVSFKGEKDGMLHFEYLTLAETGFEKTTLDISLTELKS